MPSSISSESIKLLLINSLRLFSIDLLVTIGWVTEGSSIELISTIEKSSANILSRPSLVIFFVLVPMFEISVIALLFTDTISHPHY